MISAEQYGPWALVTGGSEGVGAAFARALAEVGINLVLIARREGPLEATAGEIRTQTGVEVRTLALDISQPDMLDRIREATDDVDVGLLVSNAGGVFGGGPFLNIDLDDVQRTVRANPLCHASLAHHFGNRMAARGRGGIVLVGSLAGNAGGATMVMYSASKAFAQIFAEGLWAELEPKGVNVVYVVLGATDTPARARENLQDSPDEIIDDPNEVARFTLDNIANGPVLVRPHLAEGFAMFSSMPRRKAAETMRALLMGYQSAAPDGG